MRLAFKSAPVNHNAIVIYGGVYNDTLNPTAGEGRSFLGPRRAVAIIPFAQSKQGVTYYVVRQITRTGLA